MKKKLCFVVVCLVIISMGFSPSAQAFRTPVVSQGHGVLTLMLASNYALSLGAEFGLTDWLALSGDLYSNGISKFGLKFQVAPNLAIQGGVYSFNTAYLGLNAATAFGNNLTGILDINVVAPGAISHFAYGLGLRYMVAPRFDIRGGLCGTITTSGVSYPGLKIGAGFGF